MKTYTYRIVADTEEDIFRDIEIDQNQSFLDLHNSIMEAFEFRGDQMASFYMSNETWEKGEEIGLMDMGFGEESGPKTMSGTPLSKMMKEPHQKVLYVYDFLKMWIFYVELIKINDDSELAASPAILQKFGASPDEDAKEIPDLLDDMSDMYPSMGASGSGPSQSDIDDIYKEFDDDFKDDFGGDFENIDDLDI